MKNLKPFDHGQPKEVSKLPHISDQKSIKLKIMFFWGFKIDSNSVLTLIIDRFLNSF